VYIEITWAGVSVGSAPGFVAGCAKDVAAMQQIESTENKILFIVFKFNND
jgi:hypothetical protein